MVYYDTDVIANQIVYSIIANWIIMYAKKSKLIPFINEHTYWVNRISAIVIATISALGIDYSYSYTTAGVFTFTLTGLTVAHIWIAFKQWLVAYSTQQGVYHLTKDSTPDNFYTAPPSDIQIVSNPPVK